MRTLKINVANVPSNGWTNQNWYLYHGERWKRSPNGCVLVFPQGTLRNFFQNACFYNLNNYQARWTWPGPCRPMFFRVFTKFFSKKLMMPFDRATSWIFLYILQEYLSYFSGKFGKWKNRFEFTFAVDPHIASHSYPRHWPMQYGELLTIMRFNSCLFDTWTQHYVQ